MLPYVFPEYLCIICKRLGGQLDLFGLISVSIIHLGDTLSNKCASMQQKCFPLSVLLSNG